MVQTGHGGTPRHRGRGTPGVQEWEQRYQETRDQAAQRARVAADGASTAALYGFIGLLLGAFAGASGGRAGTPPLEVAVAETRRTHVS